MSLHFSFSCSVVREYAEEPLRDFFFSFKKTESLLSDLIKLLLNDHSQVIIVVMNVSVDSYFEKWNLLFINVFL